MVSVAKWVLAVGGIAVLALLYLRRQMAADAAVAKEEKLLRRVAAGSLDREIDRVEGQLRAVEQRAKVAEEAALDAEDRFEAAVEKARRLWSAARTTGE